MANVTGISLIEARIVGGVWEGALGGVIGTAPKIEALHETRLVEGVEVVPVPGKTGQFVVRVPIPAWALNTGVQTFLVRAGKDVLAEFTLVAGQSPEDGIRAELGLVRAELDLLKRAFQRHCRETEG